LAGTSRCDITGRVQRAESVFSRIWLRRSAAARTAQRAIPTISKRSGHRAGSPVLRQPGWPTLRLLSVAPAAL